MQLLTVDIGAGTQDILLLNPRLNVENAYKLVLPSPTLMIRRRIQRATAERRSILLHGVTMGGGPSKWAAEDHLRAGLDLYATPAAARTLDDDLEAVAASGVVIVSDDEALVLSPEVERIELRDFDFSAIHSAFAGFGVSLSRLDAVAVAVFDHGAAPAGISDRQFRFEYLERRLRQKNDLTTFAFSADQTPEEMTRLRAVVQSAHSLDAPLFVMDSAPAAVLGATYDPRVAGRSRAIFANLGNMHTLAFRLEQGQVRGLFEHHTGELTRLALERLLLRFAAGSLTNADVFDHHGHGASLADTTAWDGEEFILTGPRRSLLAGSTLRALEAAPFGDMMIAGCFGLIHAVAELSPALREPLQQALANRAQTGLAPWDE